LGKCYNCQNLTIKELSPLPPLILLCGNKWDFNTAIAEAGYQTVSLNLPLARSLIGMSVDEIRLAIDDKVRAALPQTKPVYLTDYEMLFDPRYEFDVVRLFLNLSVRNKLIVKWCGSIDADGDVLTYSEDGYDDCQRIPINGYNITIVK